VKLTDRQTDRQTHASPVKRNVFDGDNNKAYNVMCFYSVYSSIYL